MSASQESTVWSGTPSQMGNFGIFLLCALVAIALIGSAIKIGGSASTPLLALLLLPIAIAGWRWLVTHSTQYTLTDQRLKTRRGVFGRVTDDLELYRVKDSHFTLTPRTTDASTPIVLLPGMNAPEALWERIRALVETRRDAKGVREVDINAEHEAT